MKMLDKILIAIIVVLFILLGVMTYNYFKMRETAKTNLNYFFETKNELFYTQHPEAANYTKDE